MKFGVAYARGGREAFNMRLAQKLSVLLIDTNFIYLKTLKYYSMVRKDENLSLFWGAQCKNLRCVGRKMLKRIRELGYISPKTMISFRKAHDRCEQGYEQGIILENLLYDNAACSNMASELLDSIKWQDKRTEDILVELVWQYDGVARVLHTILDTKVSKGGL